MHVEGQCCQRNKLLVKIWKGTESNVSNFSIENDRTQWITPWQKNFFQGFDCDFGRIISACNHVCLLSFWIQHIQKEAPGILALLWVKPKTLIFKLLYDLQALQGDFLWCNRMGHSMTDILYFVICSAILGFLIVTNHSFGQAFIH